MTDDIPRGFEPLAGEERFVIMIGPLFQRWAQGRLTCAFRAGPQHLNAGEIVHGGMLTTLADHTLAVQIARTVAAPCATVSLNSDYLAAARAGDWIECTAAISRATRSLIFARGQVSVGETPIMTASGVWKRIGMD